MAQEGAQRITLRSIIIGVLGCIVLTAVSMYTALKLGALPWPIVFAAIIALLFLRLCGSRDLHEANVAHTMMTAGSMVAGGLAFTIPGILILGAGDVTIWQMLLVALAGTLLGLGATMVFRRRFVDDEPMEYPIGEAAAQTLIGADAGGKTAAAVFIPMAIAAIYAWIRDRMAKLPAVFFMKGQVPGVAFGLYNSPMMIAVGFLMGAVPMLVWFLGALIGDFGLVVGGSAAGWWTLETGQAIKSSLGMGLMIGGGLAVVAKVFIDRLRRNAASDSASKAGSITNFADGIANPKVARIVVLAATVLAFLMCLALRLSVVTSLVIIVLVWVAAVMAIICVGHTGIDPMEVFGLIVMLLAAADVLRQVGGIILSQGFQHSLQNDSFRGFGDILHDGNHADAVLLQDPLVHGGIIPVPGKAVQFPDKHDLELMLFRVLDHPLEVRPVILRAGKGAVDIFADHAVSVLFRVGIAVVQLTFNGLFRLGMGRITGINDRVECIRIFRSGHTEPPLLSRLLSTAGPQTGYPITSILLNLIECFYN